MVFFKITIFGTMVITLATAWSGQFPQFYHTFPSPTPPPPPPPPPMAFRPFFQEPLLAQRYFMHQPQFRQPLELYQPPARPPTAVTRPINVQLSRVLPTTQSSAPQQVTATNVHHHVFYYYFYLPAKAETLTTGRSNDGGRVEARQPCGDHPISTAECPPVYLPPPPPSPTTPPTTTQTPIPTTSVPPPSQGPCDDDSVVVDNVDYYPFTGRTPIVVEPALASVRDGSENESRDSSDQKHRPKTQPNFILANYLLPPDK